MIYMPDQSIIETVQVSNNLIMWTLKFFKSQYVMINFPKLKTLSTSNTFNIRFNESKYCQLGHLGGLVS